MFDLQQGIERDELRLHYQPVVSLRSGEIAGFEALVRWHHPQRGLLLPDQFLPVGDQSGMQAVASWAIQKACEEGRCLQGAAFTQTPVLSLNVDSGFLKKPQLVEELIGRTQDACLPPRSLAVEISERQMLLERASLRKPLELLGSFGILAYLDHFGTGFCSIPIVADLPVSMIKIDRSLVEFPENDRKGARVLAALLAVGRHLEKAMVAVGVENAEQVQLLRNGQCEWAQGNYFASALDVAAALWLRHVGAPRSNGDQIDSSRLRFFDLFRDLSDEQLGTLAHESGERDFAAGAVIIRQGQVGNEMYLLEEGTIEVYRETHHSVKPLVQLRAPTVFGEMAIVNPERIRTASVRASTNVRVVTIPIDSLLRSFQACPALKDRLRQFVAARLAH